jgi:hypothetical protein
LSTVNYIIFYAIFVSPPLPSRPPPSLAEGWRWADELKCREPACCWTVQDFSLPVQALTSVTQGDGCTLGIYIFPISMAVGLPLLPLPIGREVPPSPLRWQKGRELRPLCAKSLTELLFAKFSTKSSSV